MDFKLTCLKIASVGSRVTCDPPPTDTDIDYLALVPSMSSADASLVDQGYVTTTDHEYEGAESNFASYKRGNINVLVTDDDQYYAAFMAATHVAKRLNLMKKSDRICLFQAVLYRKEWSEAAQAIEVNTDDDLPW